MKQDSKKGEMPSKHDDDNENNSNNNVLYE